MSLNKVLRASGSQARTKWFTAGGFTHPSKDLYTSCKSTFVSCVNTKASCVCVGVTALLWGGQKLLSCYLYACASVHTPLSWKPPLHTLEIRIVLCVCPVPCDMSRVVRVSSTLRHSWLYSCRDTHCWQKIRTKYMSRRCRCGRTACCVKTVLNWCV